MMRTPISKQRNHWLQSTLIEAAKDVYQVRFKNRAANSYVVRGKSRTFGSITIPGAVRIPGCR